MWKSTEKNVNKMYTKNVWRDVFYNVGKSLATCPHTNLPDKNGVSPSRAVNLTYAHINTPNNNNKFCI